MMPGLIFFTASYPGDQFFHDAPTLVRFQVDGEAALVPIGRQVKGAEIPDKGLRPRPVALVCSGQGFDLNHISPQVRQILCGSGPLKVVAQT